MTIRGHLANANEVQEAMRAPWSHRMVAAGVAIGCLALLALAAWLEPDPLGVGTHQQLGLAPCRWVALAGIPCPTCGMTTAFALAADGRLLASLAAQPMGFVLAVLTAMAFWIAAYTAITGSQVARFTLKLWRPAFLWIVGGLALVAWVYKIWSLRGSPT